MRTRTRGKKQFQDRDDGHEVYRAAQAKIDDLRDRQKSIATILEKTFGPFGKSKPELWERQAYLQIVGMVYVRLVTQEKEISNEELAGLARILAGPRGIATGSKGKGAHVETAVEKRKGTNLKKRTDEFLNTVREIYGTSKPMEESEGAEVEERGNYPGPVTEVDMTV
ncbi:MAG: hypothetical protein AABZ47_12825 [Planctomycetota bacterium]